MSGQFFNLNQIIGGYEEKNPSAATKKIIDSTLKLLRGHE